MGTALAKVKDQRLGSTKIHRHISRQGRSELTLEEMRRSLGGIGVSLSKRVIEDRESR
jgi:hypothetical protein